MGSKLLLLEEEVFKVIANHKRLEIILLLENRELNVSQMTEMLGMRQANLSQHLTLLRQQRLVTLRKTGRESYYTLSDNSVAKSVRIIHEFLRAQHRLESPIDNKSLFPIVTDPICGMRLSASAAFSHLVDNGKTYYFCASGCEEAFTKRLEQTNNVTDSHTIHA